MIYAIIYLSKFLIKMVSLGTDKLVDAAGSCTDHSSISVLCDEPRDTPEGLMNQKLSSKLESQRILEIHFSPWSICAQVESTWVLVSSLKCKLTYNIVLVSGV